jgi:opacity protein-like surface antigen
MKSLQIRGFVIAGLAIAILLGGAPARADDLAGKASIGASLGAMRFLSGDSLSSGAGIRPMFRGTIKYVWDEHLVSIVEAGYGWNAYGPGGDYNNPEHRDVVTLAIAIPLTAGLDYRFPTKAARIMPRIGAGAGFYGVQLKSGSDQLSIEKKSGRERKKTSPGLYLKGGTEIGILPAMTLNADLLWHYVFLGDTEKFGEGHWLDQNTSFAEVRVGLNYYFTIRSGGATPHKPGSEEE